MAALAVATSAHVLEVGALVSSGPAAELAHDDKIRRAYLGVHRDRESISVPYSGRRSGTRSPMRNISPRVLALGRGVIPFLLP